MQTRGKKMMGFFKRKEARKACRQARRTSLISLKLESAEGDQPFCTLFLQYFSWRPCCSPR